MWPVSVSLSVPDARSQILIVRSADPVTNQWLVGSTAMQRTQPRWPEMTRISFHGACHSGAGRSGHELRFCRGMMYVEPRGALPTTGAACPATASRLCFAGWLSASAVLPLGAASPAFSRSALRSCSSRCVVVDEAAAKAPDGGTRLGARARPCP